MNILFVDPPPTLEWTPESGLTKAGRRWPSFSVTGERTYNYLNLSAAAVLREKGHHVSYLDCQVEDLSLEHAVQRTVDIQPDMLIMYIEQLTMEVDFEILRRLRGKITPLIVCVGPFVTPLDEEFLDACAEANVVVRGEFDYVVAKIAHRLEEGGDWHDVQGISFKMDGRLCRVGDVQHVADVDALPIPAYDLIDLSKYTESVNTNLPVATMITSRGCPYQCVYCWWPQTIYTHKWRSMSVDRVLREVKVLVEEMGVREIEFDDDIFEMNRDRVIAICEGMKQEGIDVFWAPQCRPDKVDKELLMIMRDAGCKRILYGCESGVQEVLDKMKKAFSVEDISRATKETKEAGIDVLNCFMLGFPWDTEETIERTIEFACEINAEFTQFGIPTPLPGTEYMDIIRDGGFLQTEDWSRFSGFSQAVVSFPHLHRERLDYWEKEAYRRYYLRWGYGWMMFKRAFKSWDHFRQTLQLGRAYLKRRRAGWM